MSSENETYSKDEVMAALRILGADWQQREAQGQRHADGTQWDFWPRALKGRLPRAVAEELADREVGPAPVDVSDLDMAGYSRVRNQLGIKDVGSVMGAETRPHERGAGMTGRSDWI